MFFIKAYSRNFQLRNISFVSNPLTCQTPVPNDLEIANAQRPLPIVQIARSYGIEDERVISYGPHIAKIKSKPTSSKLGRYIVVTGTTPTKFGEGKTTATLGLAQALGAHLKVASMAVIRQPSQGPLFGLKGGAAGGGYAQCIPMVDFNLHLTGDIHAITAANNFLAAAIDSRIYHESTSSDEQLLRRMLPLKKDGSFEIAPPFARRMARLGLSAGDLKTLSADQTAALLRLNIQSVLWRRALDINDRALRRVALRGENAATSYDTGFDITPASEIMAVLALARDAADLRERLGRIIVGYDAAQRPVTVEDVGAVGALLVLLRDALHPTMVQTLEGTPVLVHAGPFSNIAHGCSSVIADYAALDAVGPSGYVLTEAGFGSDLGLEKFVDIKCRSSGLFPDAAILTTTVRALRAHSALAPASAAPIDHLRSGLVNLAAHIANVKAFGIPAVVAINQFAQDTPEELALVQDFALQQCGADAAVPLTAWAHGGAGGVALAEALMRTCDSRGAEAKAPRFLYPLDPRQTVQDRIGTIASGVYGAKDVSYTPVAAEAIRRVTEAGYANLPLCMAKTPLSFSHDPKLLGAPKGFTLPILNVRLSAGAQFLVAFCGDIITMPGLPSLANFYNLDIDDNGNVLGMS